MKKSKSEQSMVSNFEGDMRPFRIYQKVYIMPAMMVPPSLSVWNPAVCTLSLYVVPTI